MPADDHVQENMLSGAVLALCSVGTAAYSLWPRYRRNRRPAEVYYWGHVAGFENIQDFVASLETSTVTAIERVQHQLWHVSRVVHGSTPSSASPCCWPAPPR